MRYWVAVWQGISCMYIHGKHISPFYCSFAIISGPLSSLHLPLHCGTVASSKVILPLDQQAQNKAIL